MLVAEHKTGTKEAYYRCRRVDVDRVRVSARSEELDNALALTKTTRYVKQRPIFRSSKGVICQVSLVEQFPQEGQVSILYGFLHLL